jgi:hypothetical protein
MTSRRRRATGLLSIDRRYRMPPTRYHARNLQIRGLIFSVKKNKEDQIKKEAIEK